MYIDVYMINELFDTFRAVYYYYYTMFKFISLFDLNIQLFKQMNSFYLTAISIFFMFTHYLLIIIISNFLSALNRPHLSLSHCVILFNTHKCTSQLHTPQFPTETITQTNEQDRLNTTITHKQTTLKLYTTLTIYDNRVKQILIITLDHA